ncbi:MAG TPA: hypothetical protein VFI03_00045 [Solirubrobacterales bacterium]|nr:hypothetical protein [Solirubrobacterales bacterium]
MLAGPAPASAADLSICSAGSGAGQCNSPNGIALDTATNRLYVADGGNNRVDVFTNTGTFLFAFGWGVRDGNAALQTCGPSAAPPIATCLQGIAGPGAGQISRGEKIAVDPVSHDVYLSETQNNRVQKFDATGTFEWMVGGEVDQVTNANLCTVAANCGAGAETTPVASQEGFFFSTLEGLPVAIGPGGNLFVADSKKKGAAESEGFNTRIQRYQADGTYLGPQMFLPPASPATVGRVQGIAVDIGGSLYAATDNIFLEEGVRKFNPDGSAVPSWGGGGKILGAAILALGLGPGENLFFSEREIGSPLVVRQHAPDGTQLRAIYGSGTVESLARGVAAEAGGVFVSEANEVVRMEIPPPGPVVLPKTCAVSGIGNTKANLSCKVNPEGKASTYHFEWVDDQTYQEDLPNGFESASSGPEESLAAAAADFKGHLAETKLPPETLAPETEYHFRIVVKNADSPPQGNPGEEFIGETNSGHPEALDAWATEVGSTTARLHGEADPVEVATTGRFEYVDEASFASEGGFTSPNTKISGQVDFGSGEEAVVRATVISGLAPGTVYHYRLRVEEAFGSSFGDERLLRTFALPDPPDANCPNQAFRSGPSAALPDCRAYEMVSPLDKDNGDILTLLNQFNFPTFIDQSSSDGSAFTYSSFRAFADPKSAPYANQYLAHRDPAQGWQSEALSPKGKGAEFLENPFKAFSADLSASWLSWMTKAGEAAPDPCAPQEFRELYRRSSAGAFKALSCAPLENALDPLNFLPEVQGFSADGTRSIFRANEAMTADASEATTVNPFPRPIYQLYQANASGGLVLVSVLPNGVASDNDSSAGTVGDTNASTYWNINRLGSMLGAVSADGSRVFWSAGTAGVHGPLYLRVNTEAPQSASGECDEADKACTIAVSGTVSPSPARFQLGNPQGTGALFTIVSGPLAGNLYRFDAQAEPPSSEFVAGGVMGSILGASEDLARVYYASEEASPQAQSEGAIAGEPNVYLTEAGETRFIATLSSSGETSDVNSLFGTPIEVAPIRRTARVSPDGGALVFMSNSGELAERVAGYDNTDAKSPARCGEEDGICDAEVYRYDAGAGALSCVSCNPTGARPSGRELAQGNNNQIGPWGAATIPRYQSQVFQPRYLSDDGKHVFFQSYEALVLADTNGVQDVYEWEAVGEGSCKASSATFNPLSEGCLWLISSGQSPSASILLDASPSGSDVFFTTLQSLLSQDYGLVDVYDAREGGGFTPPPPPPPGCQGDACQSPPPVPVDPTPASSGLQGQGNVVEQPAKKKQKKHAKKKKGKKKKGQSKKKRGQHKRGAAR